MNTKENNKKNTQQDTGQQSSGGLLKDILDFMKVFAVSAIIILFFVNFVAHPITVVGPSMTPTLEDGEYGFTSVLSMKVTTPKRGDIVIVDMSETTGQENRYWVKRIIGLPGETVECIDGVVYIDGEVLDESFLDQDYVEETTLELESQSGGQISQFTSDFGPVTLGEDEYWVMGDNRPYSKDSRDPSVGPVSRDKLYGDGVLVIWPLDKLGVH